MRRIYPQIPDPWRCESIGFIVESDDADDLSNDMLEVILPNGILVSAGWFSSGPLGGDYVVSVTRGLHNLIPPVNSRNADAAMTDVEVIVREFLTACFSHSNSESTWKNAGSSVFSLSSR